MSRSATSSCRSCGRTETGASTAGSTWVRSPASSTYAFAPGGERSIYNFLVKAIDKAQQFIYLEDQYLVAATPMAAGPSISSLLAQKVAEGGFKKLVILISRTEQVNDEQNQMWERRRQFIQPLLDAGPDKVVVCQYKQDGKPIGTENPRYVHSKTWIFDDKVLFTGSANCNRRSYTHDSEVGAAVFDENVDGDHLYFAHQVRMRIWRKVLDPGHDHKLGEQDLFDLGSPPLKYWESPPEPALIERYDVDPNKSKAPDKKFDRDMPTIGGLPTRTRDKDWDELLDPDGS